MSLSSKSSTFQAGRIIIGLDAVGMDSLASAPDQPLFTPENEKEYVERVKTRAKAKARSIITTAMHEAEGLKKRALEQGYNQGMRQAKEVLEKERQDLACQLTDIAQKLNAEKQTLWSTYRADIMVLLKASLEKALATEMEKNRLAILENLLNEALAQIDARECITITCAPHDKLFLDDLITRASTTYPDLTKWVIKEDAGMKQGGLKLESCNGMVDNSVASRYALIRDILDQISLEDSQ